MLKLICSSLLYGTRLPLGQQGARHRFCSKLMLRTADLLLALVWDETASGTVRSNTEVLLLAVPDAFSSHRKVRSRSAVHSVLSFSPRCSRGSLVPYKSEEHQPSPDMEFVTNFTRSHFMGNLFTPKYSVNYNIFYFYFT